MLTALPTQLLPNDFPTHWACGYFNFCFLPTSIVKDVDHWDVRHLAGSFKVPCLQRQEDTLGFPNHKARNQMEPIG